MAFTGWIAAIFSPIHKEAILAFLLRHVFCKHAYMAPFKRKVLYLAGFDPRGERFYRGLLAGEVAAHNAGAEAGARIDLGPRRRDGRDWHWQISDARGATQTDVLFLTWDDVVRAHWVKGWFALLRHTLASYARMIRWFAWGHAGVMRRGNWFTVYFPGISLIGLPLLVGGLVWLMADLSGAGAASLWLALAALIGAAAWGPRLLRRWQSHWLLRFVIFNDWFAAGEMAAALAPRLDHCADAIDAALGEPVDEVLLISHSNGTILAIPLLARLLARHGGRMPERFALVTLGGCIALASLRRDAHDFHDAARDVAAGDFQWLDIGALSDGACIALGEPFPGVCDSPAGLTQLSPRWHHYASPASYAARRADKFNTHFDYFRRLDRASPLDYLSLLLSARPLAASIAAFRAENGLT